MTFFLLQENHGDQLSVLHKEEKKLLKSETKKKMSRKKRHAPTPPTNNVTMEDNSPPVNTSSIMEEDLERTSSTSSPTSHDSGIEEGKPRSRDSSTSNRYETIFRRQNVKKTQQMTNRWNHKTFRAFTKNLS